MRRLLAFGAVTALFLWLTHPYWLGGLGAFLVDATPPVKVDALVVLAGDFDGNRVRRAGEVAMAGFAPKVYVSGPRPVYGVSEARLAINDAVRHGQPEALFEALDVPATSTESEAAGLVPELRKRGVKTLMVVTSNYHTRRAGKIWRRAAPEMKISLLAAPDNFFSPEGWWKNRDGRKVTFYEWVKTITEPFGV